MVPESFSTHEIMLLTQYGYDIKNNLQDAYRTYRSPALIDYTVHISLTKGREYFVKQLGQTGPELPAGAFKSLDDLLPTLEQRLLSVSM
jgi:hypothetical protein